MSKRKKLILWVSIIAVVAIVGTMAVKYNSSNKERKAVQLAKEYLAQKYEQEMIYESVRLSKVDPVLYRVSFISQNTGIKFNVNVTPSLLKFPEEKSNNKLLYDNYLGSFFCRKTEEIVLPEITATWNDNASIYVSLYPSDVYYEKNTADTNEHMTEREMESFYNYRFYITTNRLLINESKMEEAQRMLNIFQAIQKLNYHPVEILFWYQTGTIEKGNEIKESIRFVDGNILSQTGKLGNWLELINVEDVIKVMDDQWDN